MLAPVFWTGLAVAGLFAVASLIELALAVERAIATSGTPSWVFYRTTFAALTAIPVAYVVGLTRMRVHRSVMAEVVVELGRAPSPARTRHVLARAVRDPTLEVAFWAADAGGYVDPAGQPVAVEPQPPGRATSYLQLNGKPLAALSYDASLLEDPKLLEAVAAAAGLSLENARLQVELRAQLREVRASRARIVAADDTARRRLERNLHDGAQQRLVSLLLNVKLARRADADSGALLDAVEHEVTHALGELRALASGLLPPALTDFGLDAAISELAARAPLPVSVGELPDRRLPEAVEVAAYFVIAEALTNVAKHADVRTAGIHVTLADGAVRVEVSDDGIGGAALDGGTGLRGLADRVDALDGRLTITSRHDGGTLIRAEIPCAS